MIQLALAAFGLTALWMATGTNPTARKWASVVGLMGQPAWITFAVQTDAWGLLALSVAYTLVYARGCAVQFGLVKNQKEVNHERD